VIERPTARRVVMECHLGSDRAQCCAAYDLRRLKNPSNDVSLVLNDFEVCNREYGRTFSQRLSRFTEPFRKRKQD
jgi:hypothetical protein